MVQAAVRLTTFLLKLGNSRGLRVDAYALMEKYMKWNCAKINPIAK